MTRTDLEDAICETLNDVYVYDTTMRDLARAIVMMLETRGVVRCEADAGEVADLDLATIALAAIAYLDAPPLSGASWDAWEGLGRAVASYKETTK